MTDMVAILIGLASGGMGVVLLQRFFGNRDTARKDAADERGRIDAASVEFFKLQFEQIGKDRDDLREELRDCRTENRRLNDKVDSQAAEFYELKGVHKASRDQLERVTSEYFNLLQKYTACLLEVEVLRAALKEHGIEMPPNVASLVAKHQVPTSPSQEAQ